MSNPKKPRQAPKSGKLKNVFAQLVPPIPGGIEDNIQKLFRLLCKDFPPQDILEEIWLHDIARITSNIEKFRAIERSVQYEKMIARLSDLVRNGRLSSNASAEVALRIYNLASSSANSTTSSHHSTLTAIGNLSEFDIRAFASISDIIQKLQRERDRIYAQFERKRRPLVIASVTKVETQVDKPNLINTLSD